MGVTGWVVVGVLVLIVGLRFRVGADWPNYEGIFSDARYDHLGSLPTIADPGYYALNILVQAIGGQLWMVDLACALLFAWGLTRFCEAQERPWLAALVAVPYLVIVVAMGYTRQGVAIGLVMAGLASYFRTGSVIRFAVYALAAATFHKTAVVALPLIAAANERGRIVTLLMVAAITYFAYNIFLAPSVGRFVTNYIDTRYQSEGAGIRIGMSVVAAVFFLLRSKHMGFVERERRVWRNTSLAAIACAVLLFVLPSSAAVDWLCLLAFENIPTCLQEAHGIERLAFEPHLVVDVRSRTPAGIAELADRLPIIHQIPHLDQYGIEMGINGHDAEAVVDRHFVSSRKPDDLPAFCRAILGTFV